MFKKIDGDSVEEEILSIVEEGHEQGVIHEDEAEMIENVLEFDEKKVRDIMTSRSRIFAVPKDEIIGDFLKKALESGFSRYPVYEEEIDQIVGVVHIKDLVIGYLADPAKPVGDVMDDAVFVHPTYEVMKLLRKMQKEKNHIAIVLDEYGQTEGLVTLEDVLEELVGKIEDEHDKERKEVHVAEGSLIVEGTIPLHDLEEQIPGLKFPDGDIETLNGFLLYLLGRFPKEHERISLTFGGYRFTALRVENRMIRKVRVQEDVT